MANKKESLYLFLIKKLSSLYAKIAHANVPKQYLYFYRDTYVCKLLQLKYFIRDYISKNKYKVISYEGEFGAEFEFVLPFAYWHYKNGTLKKTRSFAGTKEMYFFSMDHEECFTERTNEGNYNFELPRILYSHDYNMKKWLQVPLKEVYKNDVYVFEKPLLIIANKYNMEWDGPPVSFFSIDMLEFMFSNLKNKYTIIYNRPQPKDIVNDNSLIYDLGEFEWIKKEHPEIILLNDLYEENKIGANNFNHFQLCLYSNCSNFISVHGGTAILASYFGGKNLIYSQKGGEHYFKCFEKLYPKFSGAEIYHATNEKSITTFVRDLF